MLRHGSMKTRKIKMNVCGGRSRSFYSKRMWSTFFIRSEPVHFLWFNENPWQRVKLSILINSLFFLALRLGRKIDFLEMKANVYQTLVDILRRKKRKYVALISIDPLIWLRCRWRRKFVSAVVERRVRATFEDNPTNIRSAFDQRVLMVDFSGWDEWLDLFPENFHFREP